TVVTLPSSRTQENFGAWPYLEVFAGTTPGNDPLLSAIDFSFLRFDLSQIKQPIVSASLHLHTTARPGVPRPVNPGVVGLYLVPAGGWAEGQGTANGAGFGTINTSSDPETGITGANFGLPFLAGLDKSKDLLARETVTDVNQDVVFKIGRLDLTPELVSGSLTLAVAFTSVPQYQPAEELVDFSSKEGTNPPYLQLSGDVS